MKDGHKTSITPQTIPGGLALLSYVCERVSFFVKQPLLSFRFVSLARGTFSFGFGTVADYIYGFPGV